MDTLKKYRSILEQLKGQKNLLVNEIIQLKKDIRYNKQILVKQEQAKEIIRQVGIQTQEQLKISIEAITSLALESIFDNPYTLKMDFVNRRNKTECDLYFERDGKLINPLEASGGGAVDVAAFALRVACWSLQIPHKNSIIIMDEPMKNVSVNYRDSTSQMLSIVAKKLGLQFIIVTHDPTLTTWSDNIIENKIKKGVSYV